MPESAQPALTQAEVQARAAALESAAKANTVTAPQPGAAATQTPANRPSVGRIVHFHDSGRTSIHPTTQPSGPFAAIITAVDPKGIHLHVFKPASAGIHAGYVKHKSQLKSGEPQRYWEWPPRIQ